MIFIHLQISDNFNGTSPDIKTKVYTHH